MEKYSKALRNLFNKMEKKRITSSDSIRLRDIKRQNIWIITQLEGH